VESVSPNAVRPSRRVFRGVSIAFVGPDGAGKTTVIENLMDAWSEVTRLVSMGASIDQANYSLPTSRWLTRRKRRRLAKLLKDSEVLPPARLLSEDQRRSVSGGRLVKIVGLVNRVAEEWYRYCVVATFKLLGYVVLCDRYFLFEYRLEPMDSDEPASVRVHNWLLRKFYPRPDLVILLDADAEFLRRRKPEWPLEHLEHQRALILRQSRLVHRFARVDATQPLSVVLDRVAQTIVEYLYSGSGQQATDQG
jgi:thymidylate kinase